MVAWRRDLHRTLFTLVQRRARVKVWKCELQMAVLVTLRSCPPGVRLVRFGLAPHSPCPCTYLACASHVPAPLPAPGPALCASPVAAVGRTPYPHPYPHPSCALPIPRPAPASFLLSIRSCSGTQKWIHQRCLSEWQDTLRAQGQYKRARTCEVRFLTCRQTVYLSGAVSNASCGSLGDLGGRLYQLYTDKTT